MYKDLKKYFFDKPSVSKLEKHIIGLSTVERINFYYDCYRCMFTEWNTMNRTYQRFLTLLVEHDRELFAHFLTHQTILGQLKYPCQDGELFYKMMELLEIRAACEKANRNHLVFSMYLSFRFHGEEELTLKTISKRMQRNRIDTDELILLCSKALITNIDDEYLD